MQVAKWGNSLAVRLPAALVQELGLSEGDDIDLKPAQNHASKMALEVSRQPTRAELIAQLSTLRGLTPPGYRFKRDDAYDEE